MSARREAATDVPDMDQEEYWSQHCALGNPRHKGSTVLREKLFPQGEQFSCTVCVHITAELVPSSLFVQCCTLYNLTGFLAWLKPRQIHLYLSWIRQNVVFN